MYQQSDCDKHGCYDSKMGSSINLNYKYTVKKVFYLNSVICLENNNFSKYVITK